MKNDHIRTFLSFLLTAVSALAFQHCANVMAPVGGPRDLTPPRVVEASPPNKSAHFKGDKFSLHFDEYVKLEKINQQLLISPPINEFPDIKLKGKELIVKFKEKLKPKTTYSVFFGDAIQDITEGNTLHNFTYIFSTGDKIDSLSMRGQVVDASDLKGVEDVAVMLYKNNNDTLNLEQLPLFVKPYYISKTNKEGYFSFSGLADTAYLLFALEDKNYSLTFDQPSERIAFADSLVRPQFKPAATIDSSLFDTITQWPHDSLQHFIDSLWFRADSIANIALTMHRLFLFDQPDSTQKILEVKLIRNHTLRMVFRLPADSLKITTLRYQPDSTWYMEEWGNNKDTLTWFLKKQIPDTLHLVFASGHKILDTIDVRTIPKKKPGRHNRKEEVVKKETLGWTANVHGNIIPGQKLQLTFHSPVKKIVSDSIVLVKGKDSLWHPPFLFSDKHPRKIIFPFNVHEGMNYRLNIPDSAIIDWNNLGNKKIQLTFKAKEEKEYGSLQFELKPAINQNYIFVLLNDRDKPLKRFFFSKPTPIKLNYLNPGTYRFKIIFDDNHNKKWDTGNYFKHREPEKVIYYEKKIKIRPNWEVNEVWNF
jgi:hypothetical protein